VSAAYCRITGPADVYYVRRGYTFTRHGPGALCHGGLDLCPPMLLHGCSDAPGTPRQHPVSAARRGFRRPDKMAAPGTCRHRLTPGQRGRWEQSSGLLICGFGVQEPGGALVPTWDITARGHFYVPDLSGFSVPACSRVGCLGPGRLVNLWQIGLAQPSEPLPIWLRSAIAAGRSPVARLSPSWKPHMAMKLGPASSPRAAFCHTSGAVPFPSSVEGTCQGPSQVRLRYMPGIFAR